MLGQVTRRRRTVLVDDIEEAGAIGITLQRQFEVGVLGLEAGLGLSDHLGSLLDARLNDQRAVAEDQRGDYEQRQENVGHQTAVFLEKQLRFVHCFAEALGLGDVLFRHMAYRVFSLCFVR